MDGSSSRFTRRKRHRHKNQHHTDRDRSYETEYGHTEQPPPCGGAALVGLEQGFEVCFGVGEHPN